MIDDDDEVFSAYRGVATPSVVILTADGKVASKMHSTHAIIEGVIRKSLDSEAAPPSVPPATNGKPFRGRAVARRSVTPAPVRAATASPAAKQRS